MAKAKSKPEPETVGECVQGDMVEDREGRRWALSIAVSGGFLCREVLSEPSVPPGDRAFSMSRRHDSFLADAEPIVQVWWPAGKPRPRGMRAGARKIETLARGGGS